MTTTIQTPQVSKQLQQFEFTLDYYYELLKSNDRHAVKQATQLLIENLRLMMSFGKEIWQQAKEIASCHPLTSILLESPQINHSQPWPRGYLGDAEMLDLVYGMGERDAKMAQTTQRGRWLEEAFFEAPVQATARLRLQRLAQMIDITCQQIDNPHILSIACGQLREGQLCQAISQQKFGRFVAHDQDAKSLQVAKNDFGKYGVEIFNDSLGAIFKKRIKGQFDFIYAAGLYDYLPNETAAHLTKAIFDMLKPSGKLLVANYTPETPDAAFMEAFLDWPLIYRTEEEVHQFYSLIPQDVIKTVRVFPEEEVKGKCCLYYLEIKK